MVKITVNGTDFLQCNKGDNLYEVLTSAGYIFAGNCGMNGSCNKCKVFIEETGSFIKSCRYIVENDLSVRLDKSEMDVVTTFSQQGISDKKPTCTKISENNPDYGVAIDIGTTTIAMELVNLNNKEQESIYSCLNSQIPYGADVVSRIKTAGTPDGMNKLRELVLSDIKNGVESFYKDVPASINNITKYTISGNTTMLSIISGLTTENLYGYPFEIKNPDAFYISPNDFIDKNIKNNKSVICLPNISAFVGADIASGAVSVGLDLDEKYRMLIDLGTNGEIIISNNEKGIAASTACGSAFEGCFKSNNVYGSNIFDMIALLLKRGQMDKNGILKEPYFETGITVAPGVVIDMDLIRNFQLGKSAIISGIYVLMNELGICLGDISDVYISGGFGFHLNIDNAIYLGLFPESFKDKITVSGNTSLQGAHLALIEPGFIDTINRFKEKISYADLSTTDEFNDIFVKNISF